MSDAATAAGKRAETRRKILCAARELFGQHGFEAVGVRAIGERAGVTYAALYYHFPSKRAIYEALLVEPDFRKLEDEAYRARREDLNAIVFAIIDEWGNEPSLVSMLVADTWDGDTRAREMLAQSAASFQGIVRPVLERLFGPAWEVAANALLMNIVGVTSDAVLRHGADYIAPLRTPDGRQLIRELVETILPPSPAAGGLA